MTTRNEIAKKDNKLYKKQYCEFMYCRSNSHCCDNCPANQDFDNWQGRFPCGQFKCWVDVHCDYLEKEEEN